MKRFHFRRLITLLAVTLSLVCLYSQVSLAQTPDAAKGAFTVSFRDKPVVLVQGKINGRTVTLGFDTGASHTVLSLQAARAAGVRPSGQFGTAGISAGDAVLKGQCVAVQAIPQFAQFRQLGVNVAGILGFPYLSQFVIAFDYKTKQLTLDYRTKQLKLTPN